MCFFFFFVDLKGNICKFHVVKCFMGNNFDFWVNVMDKFDEMCYYIRW